ncbi:hypothetical protein VNO80_01027 [Phaseolus coccineus]|uniref:Uncharacterized protein n=1 Tax=Phaseolus coccineus TaxID=3886 RepID=A0AAN9P0N5_PHACN
MASRLALFKCLDWKRKYFLCNGRVALTNSEKHLCGSGSVTVRFICRVGRGHSGTAFGSFPLLFVCKCKQQAPWCSKWRASQQRLNNQGNAYMGCTIQLGDAERAGGAAFSGATFGDAEDVQSSIAISVASSKLVS